ncbi:hypothetical protein AWN90_32230 [Nocardia terpenica]|uniref:Uncharacterized protein n=1 Tax=Nocardia terpenica TaxID=455432 RepID=A0A164MG45_9NOCA|nr:hypothetical protein AWN90_32230 [Nocardia terpenica]
MTFGRDPLDVIFTAASPKVTFPAQDSIAVDGIPGGVSSCAVKPDTGGNELLCSIRPIGDSGPVQLSGDILFRPKVQIADDTSKGETYTGGSVLYYGEAGAPGTVTAAVNFQVAVS